MARVIHTAQTLNGNFATTGKNITWTAATPADDERTLALGTVLILARNVGASSRTVTITSVAYFGRTGDVAAHSIAAGAQAAFGPFQSQGWAQSDGYIYFEGSHAEVEFAVLKIS